MNSNIKVMIVDDRIELLNVYERVFSIMDCSLTCVSNEDSAIKLIREDGYNVVFVDYNLGTINGIELCNTIRTINKHIAVFLISGSTVDPECYSLVDYILIKPITLTTFKETILFGYALFSQRCKYGQ
jgi:CheY-like chemotaxis protein